MNRKTFFKRGLAAIAGIFFGARAAASSGMSYACQPNWTSMPRFGINPEWVSALWSQVRLPDGRDEYFFSGTDGSICRDYFLKLVKDFGGEQTGMRAKFSPGYFEKGETVVGPVFTPIEPFIRLDDLPPRKLTIENALAA